ncbi:prepilin-type N-terminal cleavage/methylation domain-containing protein [Cohnella lupini]|uniref:Prepilin-type N-terminal cleavage/methylation domain-containing protein n=1 Tax=Cohnella lupini TaxID=1294267 RepID=A0A3D9IJK3_9BACL|nr:prepilin-type N-terminal cleavage/methylation domain-containing protein [Cohnella lupini]RED61709.1 prepilin-type N-terminal cleavage/methylation domain-containing protein [Cohnella lupini]
MRKFANRLKDERGLSLIEMIASLTLLSLVTATIYGVISFGLDSYHRVTIENSLRDEADLLMSSVITELYAYGPDTVSLKSDDGNNVTGIKLNRKLDTAEPDAVEPHVIQIKSLDKGLYIGAGEGQKLDIQSEVLPESSIRLNCDGLRSCGSGLIEIELVLSQKFKDHAQTMKLESKFGF